MTAPGAKAPGTCPPSVREIAGYKRAPSPGNGDQGQTKKVMTKGAEKLCNLSAGPGIAISPLSYDGLFYQGVLGMPRRNWNAYRYWP